MVFKQQQFHETDAEIETEFPPRATLETAVADALASAGGLDATDVSVTAEGSAIVLSGMVQTSPESTRAEEVARAVVGVTGVRNEIRFGVA